MAGFRHDLTVACLRLQRGEAEGLGAPLRLGQGKLPRLAGLPGNNGGDFLLVPQDEVRCMGQDLRAPIGRHIGHCRIALTGGADRALHLLLPCLGYHPYHRIVIRVNHLDPRKIVSQPLSADQNPETPGHIPPLCPRRIVLAKYRSNIVH